MEHEKIYFNLNIQYEYKYFYSTASARYDLLQPIVDHGGNYQLTVTDIQVDTRLIPLFIAELKDYQSYDTLRTYPTALQKDHADSFIHLNYWIQVSQGLLTLEKVYLKKPVITKMDSTSKNSDNEYTYNQRDKNLYIYSYQQFLDLVNVALTEALPVKYRTYGNCGFVIRNNKLCFLVQNKELFNELRSREYNQLKIHFSHSLFQYLGVGFPVKSDTDSWDYIFPYYGEYDNQYFALIQNESSLQSWNNCKAIVIYSSNLPVEDETFPTTEIKQDLTHYTTNAYNIKHLYSIGDKKKIIYIHYIDYNQIKSLANGISAHNSNTENGLKVDIERCMPINKIDMNIGWMDVYGNLLNLEIPYGGCCNIRLCFSRKQEITYYDYTKNSVIQNQVEVRPAMEYEPIQGIEPTFTQTNWSPSMDTTLTSYEYDGVDPFAQPENETILPFDTMMKNNIPFMNDDDDGEEIIDENTIPPPDQVTELPQDNPYPIPQNEETLPFPPSTLESSEEFNNVINDRLTKLSNLKESFQKE